MKKNSEYFIAVCLLISILAGIVSCSKSSDTSGTQDAGKGGSLARFTIAMNHLYVVDNRELHTFSISNPQNPVKVNTNEVGFDVETIYTWNDKLFIGSRDAMYVYSIADPGQPQLLGTASHVRACDPVVANDSIAFVTVRSGSNCGGDINALYVYNLKNIIQPVQMKVINLQNPHGLGMKDSTLFVCDAGYGLKIYDIQEPYEPVHLRNVTGETFYDCIPDGNLLICMIEGGMAIYDITDRNNITLKARITD